LILTGWPLVRIDNEFEFRFIDKSEINLKERESNKQMSKEFQIIDQIFG